MWRWFFGSAAGGRRTAVTVQSRALTLGTAMRISRIETIPVDRYLFVQVHTDEGIVGLGEVGTWGFLEAAEQVVRKFATYLVGQDPLRRSEEHTSELQSQSNLVCRL